MFECQMLIIVHTAPDFFEARIGIRNTYGRYISEGLAGNSAILFLIGNVKKNDNSTHNQLIRTKLKQEQDFFGDILQVKLQGDPYQIALFKMIHMTLFINKAKITKRVWS